MPNQPSDPDFSGVFDVHRPTLGGGELPEHVHDPLAPTFPAPPPDATIAPIAEDAYEVPVE